MESNELALGTNYKYLKKINLSKYSNEEDENWKTRKCNLEEIKELLYIQKQMLGKPIERPVLSEAEWDEELKMAKVTKVAKNLTQNFAHSRNKSIYLYPEECLCLIELKCLILKWNEKVLSIKNAYSLLLKTGSGCTFEQFRTYTYLVKMGFRVFKHDNTLKNDLGNSKDLTKVSENSSKQRKININNSKKIKNNFKKQVIFPKINSSGWVIICRPPSHCMPHNIQPKYDTYTFNMSLISNAVVITEVIPFNKTLDFKMTPFFEKKSIVCDKSKTIGTYPVYEKNICYSIKSKTDTSDKPQIKRFKIMETENNCFIKNIVINTSSTWSGAQFFHDSKSNNKINMTEKIFSDLINDEMKYEEDLSTCMSHNDIIIDSTLNDVNNSNVTNCKINQKDKVPDELYINVDQKTNKNTMTDSITILNVDSTVNNSEQYKPTTSKIIHKEFGIEFKLPSRIKEKLFAVKPTKVHNKSTENVNNIHYVLYDIYYPDNKVPKTSRPAPDFRVIIFDDYLETFPNIYDVNICNPNDNISTLWAIVNSSSVSFYNVNNIIIPKSTDWKIKS